eukprot:4583234-Alexandrium_andersonii.AAC.1
MPQAGPKTARAGPGACSIRGSLEVRGLRLRRHGSAHEGHTSVAGGHGTAGAAAATGRLRS